MKLLPNGIMSNYYIQEMKIFLLKILFNGCLKGLLSYSVSTPSLVSTSVGQCSEIDRFHLELGLARYLGSYSPPSPEPSSI